MPLLHTRAAKLLESIRRKVVIRSHATATMHTLRRRPPRARGGDLLLSEPDSDSLSSDSESDPDPLSSDPLPSSPSSSPDEASLWESSSPGTAGPTSSPMSSGRAPRLRTRTISAAGPGLFTTTKSFLCCPKRVLTDRYFNQTDDLIYGSVSIHP